MRTWLSNEQEKLKAAEAKKQRLYIELEKTNDNEKFKEVVNAIANVTLKIENIKARINGKWAVSRPETYGLSRNDFM